MSDFCEMAKFVREHFDNAEKTQMEATACALTKKFNCVCPACDRNDVCASKAVDKKADKQGPTFSQ